MAVNIFPFFLSFIYTSNPLAPIPIIKERSIQVIKYECGNIDFFLGTTNKEEFPKIKQIALDLAAKYPDVYPVSPWDFRNETKFKGKLWYTDENGFNIFENKKRTPATGLVASDNDTGYEIAIWFRGEVEGFDADNWGDYTTETIEFE